MTTLLDNLTLEELYCIFESEKFKQIQNKFGVQKTQVLIREAENSLKNKYLHPNKFNNKFTQTLLSASEGISNPLYLLWYISSVFAASIFTVICYAFLPVTIMIGGIYLFSTYKEETKLAEKEEQHFHHSLMQLYAINAIIKRQEKQLHPFEWLKRMRHSEIDLSHDKPKQSFSDSLPNVRKSVNVGFSTALTVVGGAYCFGVVLGACGFTAVSTVLLGPIGLGVAFAVGIGAGIVVACKYYQAAKKAKLIEKNKSNMKKDLQAKHEDSIELTNLLEKQMQRKKDIDPTLESKHPAKVNEEKTSGKLKRMWNLHSTKHFQSKNALFHPVIIRQNPKLFRIKPRFSAIKVKHG